MRDAPAGDDNPLPDYYLLLGNAHATSEVVDHFDLRSEDPSSAAEFQRLLKESTEAQMELCRYVLRHGDALLVRFNRDLAL
jgi:hypothetical protein